MTPAETKTAFKTEMVLAGGLVASGFVICVLALSQLSGDRSQANSLGVPQLAQATQPLQSTPGADTKRSSPPEPTTTGARPYDIAPEPAQPDAEAQQAGSKPALPPAPAEKVGDPISKK
jgi:hypothetical protein